MLAPEVAKKIKEIQIHTRRALKGTQVGGHVTSQKGSGYEFDQLRAYEFGDDIRFVDWKSSARSNQLLVKQYFEEKNRIIWICLDVSSSTFFSSQKKLKSDVMQQVAGIFTLLGEYDKDNVGLILFADDIKEVIYPGTTKAHSMRVLEAIFDQSYQEHSGTDLTKLCEHIAHKVHKKSLVVIISDFIDNNFYEKMQLASMHRDIVAIRCLDVYEKTVPSIGYFEVQDSETSQSVGIDFSGGVKKYEELLQQRVKEQNQIFKQYAIDVVDITPGRDVVNDIILFFRKRMAWR